MVTPTTAQLGQDEPQVKPESDGEAPADTTALIKGRYCIQFESPLPDLDSPRARAYLAVDERGEKTKLFALVCSPGMPVRAKAFSSLVARHCASVLDVVVDGIVHVPQLNRSCLVVVMQRPEGGRLADALLADRSPLSETAVIGTILPRLTEALSALDRLELAHRALRPDNIFFLDAKQRDVVLGECFSEPPGAGQPVAYEPLDRAMAHPDGRGEGGVDCDCFALGVLLITLLSGTEPWKKQDDETLIEARVRNGSYRALAGEARLPGVVRDLAMGLLSDNPETRLTIEDVRQWCRNARVPPKPNVTSRRANKPFRFFEQDYYFDRTLARALSDHSSDAAQIIHAKGVEVWMRGGLEDRHGADKISALTEESRLRRKSGETSADEAHQLVGQVCHVLDPFGPIRYRGLAIFADGLGPMLAQTFARGGDRELQAMKNLLARDLPGAWITARRLSGIKKTAAQGQLLRLRAHVNNGTYGYGLERCLYELNPALPCLSPAIATHYVTNLKAMLFALDREAATADQSDELFDRHIAAFIAERWDGAQRRLAAYVKAGSDAMAQRQAMLRLFADLQKSNDVGPLRGIAGWIGKCLEPTVNGFRNPAKRRRFGREFERLAGGGNLAALVTLFRSLRSREADEKDFQAAAAMYSALEREVEAFKTQSKSLDGAAAQVSRRITVDAGYSVLALAFGAVILAMVL